MATLLRLPNEILHLIAAALDPQNLCNLRLASRRMNSVTLPAISKRCFATRCVMLQQSSLDNLVKISQHPVLGPSVVKLAISLDHLKIERPEGDPGYLFADENGVVDDDLPAYGILLGDQMEMMRSGLNSAYLAQAMAALPNLDTVFFNHDDHNLRPWGGRGIERQTGLPLEPAGVDLGSIEFVEQALRAVLLAIASSRHAALRKFEIKFGADENARICLDMLAIPGPVIRYIRANPPSLTDLVLWLQPYNTVRYPRYVPVDIAAFISLFPKLQRLHLGFHRAEDYYLHFDGISRDLHLQDLRFLKLSMLRCTYGELTALLRSHKDTLKEVVLHLVDLVPDKQDWPSFLAAMRDELSLQVLTVNLCSSDWKCVEFCRQSESGSLTCLRRFDLGGTWQAWTDAIDSIVMREMHGDEILWLPQEVWMPKKPSRGVDA